MNGPADYTSSKDAYMLIYARRQKVSTSTESVPGPQAPALDKVAGLNRQYEEACNTYLKK